MNKIENKQASLCVGLEVGSNYVKRRTFFFSSSMERSSPMVKRRTGLRIFFGKTKNLRIQTPYLLDVLQVLIFATTFLDSLMVFQMLNWKRSLDNVINTVLIKCDKSQTSKLNNICVKFSLNIFLIDVACRTEAGIEMERSILIRNLKLWILIHFWIS